MRITNKDILQMEAGGVFDYWNRLTIFIREFVDRNYPLSKLDMKSIMDDNLSENVLLRRRATQAMQDKLHQIAARELKANKQNMGKFSAKPSLKQLEQTKRLDEKLVAFQQEILEAHWEEMCENQLKEQNMSLL